MLILLIELLVYLDLTPIELIGLLILTFITGIVSFGIWKAENLDWSTVYY